MSKNGNDPAFPVTPAGEALTKTQGETQQTHLHATAQHYGLTKRELFAGLSLMGQRAAGAFDPQQAITDADALCQQMAER